MLQNYIILDIQRQTPTVRGMEQCQCRGDNALGIFRMLLDRMGDPLDGKRILLSFWDWPPGAEAAGRYDLAFCSTKIAGEPNAFLEMPCPYSLAWPEVGIADGGALLEALLTDESPVADERMFWIGGNSHVSRRRLCELSQERPEVLSAELMDFAPAGSGISKNRRDACAPFVRDFAPAGSGISKNRRDACAPFLMDFSPANNGVPAARSGRFVSLPDHRRYKYLVDCPGLGYSARLRWLLATGRPVFIVDRPFVEPWQDELIPWRHFVPVRADLADLWVAWEFLESQPALYATIAREAQAFVRGNLTMERQLERMERGVRGRLERVAVV